ncbi:sugar ABC transporter ATP-binding protein [Nocardioides limicola]|uniref:sugar ABC transporter ATP-binding protein n=1 Tax=Nocardioides limicola TaxID=2803368 RepID=UPI00193C236C|nr:sugar ABC transporter ATP-binding protein [Nocardioides sp. DJM-14]
MRSTAALRVSGVSKSFNGTTVLHDVDLEVPPGTVHALVGHNGSGKSTLIKVLAGYHRPDHAVDGHVFGEVFRLGDHTSADEVGLRFVHQDLGLVDALSAVDNLALGAGYLTRGRTVIDWRRSTERTWEVIRSLGFDFDVHRPVGELGAAQRAGVAIARALQDWSGKRAVIVLDEPTAAMPSKEAQTLFRAVRRLREQGLGVVYVTHHLNEVHDLADEVTVLRGGRVVATRPAAELSHDDLVDLILGGAASTPAAALPSAPSSTSPVNDGVVLEAKDLTTVGLSGFNLTLRVGEVVGIAGVDGSGRGSVIPAMAGVIPRAGSLTVGGAEVAPGEPRHAIKAGLGPVPADRLRTAVVPDLDVTANLSIASLGSFRRFGLVDAQAERRDAVDWLSRLTVDLGKANDPILTLSGGNQQKVIVGRWLRRQPKVIALDEPTQGVDVGARGHIYALLRDATRSGSGVLMASTDSEELAAECDRVVVVAHGRIVGELAGDQLTVQAIDSLALSAKK